MSTTGGPAPTIDLNADLGEGFGIWRLGDDDALLDVVTSANVACGFHAGDPLTMRRVCERAVARGVAIGAQVGYRDLAGFGRRRIDMDPDELSADIIYQIGALDAFARAAGDRVRYVKPHGALYNTAMTDPVQADAVAAAVTGYSNAMPLLGQPGSELARAAAAHGVAYVAEAFADRAYTSSGRLVPRGQPGAVIDDPGAVVARSLAVAIEQSVAGVDGTQLAITAQSLCLHGDTSGAADLARRVRSALIDAGVRLAPFAD
jgi:5-oxoprolinase (ATP-hydrolysing) subunit A